MPKEDEYRRFYENAIEGIFRTTPEGHFLDVNPAFARMYGYSSAAEMVKTVTDIGNQLYVDSEDRTCLWKLLEKYGSVSGFEVRMYDARNQVRWISLKSHAIKDDKGNIECIEGFAEDITTRKEAEVAIQESEEKYRAVVEDSVMGFYIIQSGLFKFVNKRFCEIFGYTYDEIVDKLGPGDLTHPEDRQRVIGIVEERAKGRLTRAEYDFKGLGKDGRVLTVKVIGTTVMYKGKRAASGSIIDITKERELEAKLRQAQKMEALGNLPGGIAHDFNNILTVLTGYATLLKMETTEKDRFRAYAEEILSATTRAAQLTNGLLAFSRQQPIVLSPVNINSVIREIERLLKRLIREDVALSVILAPEDMIVMADPGQIDQILFNLAANGRDAMPGGGALSIETRATAIDHDFVRAHGFGEPGEYVVCPSLIRALAWTAKHERRSSIPSSPQRRWGKEQAWVSPQYTELSGSTTDTLLRTANCIREPRSISTFLWQSW